MRTHAIRLLVGATFCTSLAVLTACAEPQVQERDTAIGGAVPGASTAQRVAELSQQLESVSRYASRMEELYAVQEAEILALRAQVASLTSDPRSSD
jgi:hypothetical protein